jgi:hypothetical protein
MALEIVFGVAVFKSASAYLGVHSSSFILGF